MPSVGRFDFEAEEANARRVVYAVLAEVFRSEPSVELLLRLRRPEFLELYEDCHVDPQGNIPPGEEEQAAKDLAVEYTRLFLGPGSHVSPHESVLKNPQSGTLNGPETGAVKDFIVSAGLKYEKSFSGLPDHLSVELEFLAHLADTEARAWREGNVERGKNARRWQYTFITNHLATWVVEFVEQVSNRKPHSFYGEFALLLDEFIKWELEYLETVVEAVALTPGKASTPHAT